MAAALASTPLRSRRRYADVDLAVRLRVSHLVEGVDFEPAGLPPAATLIVRRFADPLPRCLRSDASALVPAPAWERAARSGLAELARRAARPALGAVPSDAGAVLFADEAELLACFSRDFLRGEASSLWWWRTMLRSSPFSASGGLVETWRSEVRYVPSALSHLAARGEAEWVLHAFSAAQVLTILEDVVRTFEIEPLRVAFQSAPWNSSQSHPATSRAGLARFEDAMGATDAPAAVAPPWRSVLPAEIVPARLGRERMALLGVSLVLSRAPGIARGRSFTEAFSRWYWSTPTEAGRPLETARFVKADAEHSGSDLSVIPSAEQPPDKVELLGYGHPIFGSIDAEAPAALKSLDEQTSIAGRTAKDLLTAPFHTHGDLGGRSEDAAAEAHASGETHETSRHQHGLNPETEAAPRLDQAQQAVLATPAGELTGSAKERFEAAGPAATILRQLDAGEGVATELGGILYLINALRALRLPNSLDEACDCQLGLGSWELVELIARCLLGTGQARLSSDPIWTVLATLDGRLPEQKAGTSFAPASCYRVPAAWIPDAEPLCSPNNFAIRLRGRQFEIWHRLGFPCAIRQLDQPPTRAQIEREMEERFGLQACPFLRRYPQLWTAGRLLDFAPERPLRRFLSFLFPFVHWRLAAALGLQTTQKSTLAEALLLRAGRIWVTSTHVDLAMDLGQATGPVRLAGLDADPGWVPELGRVIKFHFH